MGRKLNPELDEKVVKAMTRTMDAIGFDLQEMYDDGIIPKGDAREVVLDADRIHLYGNMDAETSTYYIGLSWTHKQKLAKKATPYDLC